MEPREYDREEQELDMWAGYDPGEVKAALRERAEALAGVDRGVLLKDIHEGRQQSSRGRPA